MEVGWRGLPGKSEGRCGSDLDAGGRWGGESDQYEREGYESLQFHFLYIAKGDYGEGRNFSRLCGGLV